VPGEDHKIIVCGDGFWTKMERKVDRDDEVDEDEGTSDCCKKIKEKFTWKTIKLYWIDITCKILTWMTAALPIVLAISMEEWSMLHVVSFNAIFTYVFHNTWTLRESDFWGTLQKMKCYRTFIEKKDALKDWWEGSVSVSRDKCNAAGRMKENPVGRVVLTLFSTVVTIVVQGWMYHTASQGDMWHKLTETFNKQQNECKTAASLCVLGFLGMVSHKAKAALANFKSKWWKCFWVLVIMLIFGGTSWYTTLEMLKTVYGIHTATVSDTLREEANKRVGKIPFMTCIVAWFLGEVTRKLKLLSSDGVSDGRAHEGSNKKV
jgi:hypothetical protein